jgi:rubrerythrin
VAEGFRTETLEDAGYVRFFATGERAAGEYRCSECCYGVTVNGVLPRCPMCGGKSWELSPRFRPRRLR